MTQPMVRKDVTSQNVTKQNGATKIKSRLANFRLGIAYCLLGIVSLPITFHLLIRMPSSNWQRGSSHES